MSAIEIQMLTGFAVAVAYLIALGAGCVILGVLIDAGLTWWDRREAAADERREYEALLFVSREMNQMHQVRHIVAVAQPTREPAMIRRWDVPEDMYDLIDVTDPKHDGLRCPQGMRVIHGGRK